MKSNYFAVAPQFKLMHSFYGCAFFCLFRLRLNLFCFLPCISCTAIFSIPFRLATWITSA